MAVLVVFIVALASVFALAYPYSGALGLVRNLVIALVLLALMAGTGVFLGLVVRSALFLR